MSLTARLLDLSVSVWTGQLAAVSAVSLAICTVLIRQWMGVKVTLVSVRQMSLWTRRPWRDPSLWLKELQQSEQSRVQLHNTEQQEELRGILIPELKRDSRKHEASTEAFKTKPANVFQEVNVRGNLS